MIKKNSRRDKVGRGCVPFLIKGFNRWSKTLACRWNRGSIKAGIKYCILAGPDELANEFLYNQRVNMGRLKQASFYMVTPVYHKKRGEKNILYVSYSYSHSHSHYHSLHKQLHYHVNVPKPTTVFKNILFPFLWMKVPTVPFAVIWTFPETIDWFSLFLWCGGVDRQPQTNSLTPASLSVCLLLVKMSPQSHTWHLRNQKLAPTEAHLKHTHTCISILNTVVAAAVCRGFTQRCFVDP